MSRVLTPGTAVIVGASSGIGEALARRLAAQGWRVGLAARRLERLHAIAGELGPGATAYPLDIAQADAAAGFAAMVADLGGADLVVLSSGTGHLNGELAWALDEETLRVNVVGFAAVAQAAMRYFLTRGGGHLVGISSVAALRGSPLAAAYAASKSFQSTYLDGLRAAAARCGVPVTVTEIKPGFVATDMMKPGPESLPWIMRKLLVAAPGKAARQIEAAIRRRAKHAYVTRRYAAIGFLMRRLPRPG